MLTREDQRALDSTFYELRNLKTETRISTMAVQMDAKRREQPRKSILAVDMDALLREKREERQREAMQFMASRPPVQRPVKRPAQRYSTKARSETAVLDECYALKKKLPASARKRFEAEYNSTVYGQERALIDKYSKLYSIR